MVKTSCLRHQRGKKQRYVKTVQIFKILLTFDPKALHIELEIDEWWNPSP